MEPSRWWRVAVLGVAAILLGLVLANADGPVGRAGGIACVALLVGSVLLLHRRALRSPRVAVLLACCLVLACAVGTALVPSFATAQCIVFPLLWMLAPSMRAGVAWNVSLALAVGAGFLITDGTGPENLAQSAITVALSLGLSLGLGFWFQRVYDLVAERDRLITELHAAQETVATLSRDAGVLDERERLAREIHDTVAQDLAGLVLTAQRGRRALDSGDAATASAQFGILEDNARAALTQTRGLVAASAPVAVEGGLATTLDRLGERFQRETGITVTVSTSGFDAGALDRPGEVVLLRCAQEALANVRKHSSARSASVTVRSTATTVDVRVVDTGTGFDPASVGAAGNGGFGLAGLRDRLALAGGSLSVESAPGSGVVLTASLPARATDPVVAP